MQNTPVTRRSAIRTGALATIVAGLSGAAGTTVSAAAEAPTPASDLAAVLCATLTPGADAEFADWVTEWTDERASVHREYQAVHDAIAAFVPVDRQYELVGRLSDLAGDLASLSASRDRELLFRHLPGLAPMLRLVWDHVAMTHLGDELACSGGYCRDVAQGPY
jgi:hypothetical protein